MILRAPLGAALIVVGVSAFARVSAETPVPLSSPSGSVYRSEPPVQLAPYQERLAKAKSVAVQTDVLGLGIDQSLERAHATLDSLCDPAGRPKEKADNAESEEREQKVLWHLAKTDFDSVFVKVDEKERVTHIAGFLRKGKEVPFEKIGEVEKAPIQSDKMVAWDVVRPNRPLLRVVARGAEGRASSITIFIVKRASGEK